MRILLLVLATLVASACAAPLPSTFDGKASAGGGIQLYGTLAPVGSFEWKAAPAFTKLEMFRRRSIIFLDADRITAGVMRWSIARADEIRKKLDDAAAADRAGEGAKAERLLAEALEDVGAAMDQLLRSRK